MKALVLAAGRGTRLGELGVGLPKPMLPLQGRPLLAWTLQNLRMAGVTHVVVNLHHAPGVIPAYFGDGSAWGLHVNYLVEPEILGTAGAVRNARQLLEGGTFLVVYGDTVLDWDASAIVQEHIVHRPIATMVVDEVEDASRLGVVSWNQQGWVEGFFEKPGNRPDLGRWVSAGLLVVEPSIINHIPADGPSDFGLDIFPRLLASGLPLRAYRRPRPLLLIDTPEQYSAAQHTWVPPEVVV